MRVADDIESASSPGNSGPGARLLSKRDLASYYGVAFHTVRQVMAVLRERGLIDTVHGRGTFAKAN